MYVKPDVFNPPAAMTIQELQNAKLSSITAGYLAIYLKLSDLYDAVWDVAAKQYADPKTVTYVSKDFCNALAAAQNEVMRLAERSIIDSIEDLDNSTEI